jgi:hypothetical protein
MSDKTNPAAPRATRRGPSPLILMCVPGQKLPALRQIVLAVAPHCRIELFDYVPLPPGSEEPVPIASEPADLLVIGLQHQADVPKSLLHLLERIAPRTQVLILDDTPHVVQDMFHQVWPWSEAPTILARLLRDLDTAGPNSRNVVGPL